MQDYHKSQKEILEDLKFQLDRIEEKIRVEKDELNALEAEKTRILREMGKYSNEQYEEDMLARVYEQRRGK